MSGKGEKKRRRALDAYSRLQRAAALSAAAVEAEIQAFGLSASQYGVLDTLNTRGSVHQQELAEALGRSKAQMTAIIDTLEGKSLVRRERHATDRRYMTIHLTPDGVRVLAEATPHRTAAIVELMSGLTGDQRARLARLCRRLLRVLDPTDDSDPSSDETDDAEPVGVPAAVILPHSQSVQDRKPDANVDGASDGASADAVIDPVETPTS